MTQAEPYGAPRKVWVEDGHVFVEGHDGVIVFMDARGRHRAQSIDWQCGGRIADQQKSWTRTHLEAPRVKIF